MPAMSSWNSAPLGIGRIALAYLMAEDTQAGPVPTHNDFAARKGHFSARGKSTDHEALVRSAQSFAQTLLSSNDFLYVD